MSKFYLEEYYDKAKYPNPKKPPQITVVDPASFSETRAKTMKNIASATNCEQLLSAFESLYKADADKLWKGVSWAAFLSGKWKSFGCKEAPFEEAYEDITTSKASGTFKKTKKHLRKIRVFQKENSLIPIEKIKKQVKKIYEKK